MGTDKPRISILMAVYEPRLNWLREQLDSLEAQTYPNLRLYVRDDCSTKVPFEDISRCVAECIHSFPYEIRRNGQNLGSNLTFQALTEEAEGQYFAYCDQDDVWLPEKLTVLQEELEKSGAQLLCSDMYIIDGEGRQTADSITQVRRHHHFRSGEGLAPELLLSNFVTGCTMLIPAQTAKAAVPFCPYMVHDHYLALIAAMKGEIVSLPRDLIRYRIHGANQTELMAGVTDRESYIEIRIRSLIRRFTWLRDNLPGRTAQMQEEIERRLLWARARERNMTGRGGMRAVWRDRRFSPISSAFEILAPYLPECVFLYAIGLSRNNKV